MSKKTVLITGVGGDIGQSIIKCLREINYNFILLGCDIDPYAAGKDEVEKFLIAPKTVETDRYFRFIRQNADRYKIRFIYPTTEAEIVFFNLHREYFQEREIIVFINRASIINTFFDKYKTIKFLKENDIPCPDTFLVQDYDNQLDFPILIKPRRGCSSRGVVKINNKEEFDFYKKRIRNAIVQEYISNEDSEYTTGVFSNGGKVYSITFKRLLGFGGVSKIAQLIIDNKFFKLAEKIAHKSGLIGSMNIQIRKRKRKLLIFEINPRFSSTVYFRHCFGFQDVKWWLDIKENKDIKYIPKFKNGVVVRTLSEKFFNLD